MTLRTLVLASSWIGLVACVAPGFQGLGGTVQGTASVEALERQAPVTPAPSDAGNAASAAYYGSGPRHNPHRPYGGCGRGRCDRPYRYD